jgi:hypothetical protein
MNLPRAVADHGQSALDDLDRRIAALLTELADLHRQRVTVVMHMTVAALGATPTLEGDV